MTMSVEPAIVDANVLIYALDAEAPQRIACRTLLEAAQGETATSTLYVTLQILCEFYAIVTNTRRVLKPRSSFDALPRFQICSHSFACCRFRLPLLMKWRRFAAGSERVENSPYN